MSDQGGPQDTAPARPHLTRVGRLRSQWAEAMRRADERVPKTAPTAPAGTSNFSRAEVPYGVDLAAAWSWRFLVIVAAGLVLFEAIGRLSVLIIPLVIALLVTALVEPVVTFLERIGVRRGAASLFTLLLTVGVVALLLTLAGQQVAGGASDLRDSTIQGLGEIKDWLHTGPFHLSDKQLTDYFNRAQDGIQNATTDHFLSRAGEVGSVFADTVAGFFIVLLATYFFLADGDQIWAFLVRLAPRAARERVDSSGKVAWISLTKFVHATCIVAVTDALLISIGAAILGLPFVMAIGVLVFLGAFVPILGATVAGTVAILVALVDQGFYHALVMLAIVIAVNQIESHGLQPFLMGRWVKLHPLGVIVAIGTGVIVAGVPGALVAVPMAAALNAVVQHLAGFTQVGDNDPREQLDQDYAEEGETPPDEKDLRDEVDAHDDSFDKAGDPEGTR